VDNKSAKECFTRFKELCADAKKANEAKKNALAK